MIDTQPDIQPPAIIEELVIYPTLLNTLQFEIEIASIDPTLETLVIR